MAFDFWVIACPAFAVREAEERRERVSDGGGRGGWEDSSGGREICVFSRMEENHASARRRGGRGRFRKEKYEAFGCDVVSGACLKEEDGEDKIVAKRRYC
jgi:hypothetical protein